MFLIDDVVIGSVITAVSIAQCFLKPGHKGGSHESESKASSIFSCFTNRLHSFYSWISNLYASLRGRVSEQCPTGSGLITSALARRVLGLEPLTVSSEVRSDADWAKETPIAQQTEFRRQVEECFSRESRWYGETGEPVLHRQHDEGVITETLRSDYSRKYHELRRFCSEAKFFPNDEDIKYLIGFVDQFDDDSAIQTIKNKLMDIAEMFKPGVDALMDYEVSEKAFAKEKVETFADCLTLLGSLLEQDRKSQEKASQVDNEWHIIDKAIKCSQGDALVSHNEERGMRTPDSEKASPHVTFLVGESLQQDSNYKACMAHRPSHNRLRKSKAN